MRTVYSHSVIDIECPGDVKLANSGDLIWLMAF